MSYKIIAPMPRDDWRRRKERAESWLIAAATIIFLGLIFLVVRLAHAQGAPVTPVPATAPATPTTLEWNALANQLVTVALTTILSVLSAVVALLGKKLHEYLATKIKNERVRGVLDRLDDAAIKVVQAVEQSVVKSLDATKTPEANAATAKAAAMTSLKTQLGGDAGAMELKTVLGLGDQKAVDDMLSTAIESAVHEVNTAKPAKTAA